MLRDYQERMIKEAREKLRKVKRVLIQSATGSGKTAIGASIIKAGDEKGKSSLFLAHRQEIARQSIRTLNKFGVSAGFIMRGELYNPDYMHHVGMIETVRRRLDKLRAPEIVIVDEAHHCTAASWKKSIDYFSGKGAIIVGLSAHPERLDGKGLGDIFEDIILGPPIKELIANGYLSPYKYYAPPPMANFEGVHKKFGEFDQKELAARLDKPQVFGDAISHYKKLIPGKKAIAFHINIDASKNYTRQCAENGIKCLHVDGTMSSSEREYALYSFENGDTEQLSNVDLLGEGLDVKACAAVIMLRRTASLSLFLQMIGRAFRLYLGKEFCYIFDHVNNVQIHGLPDDDREYSLEGNKRKAKEAQEIVSIKQCTACYHVYKPQPVCPNCGNVHIVEPPKIEVVDMELQEFIRKEKRKEVGVARSLQELLKVEKERGYKPGWAYMVYNSRRK